LTIEVFGSSGKILLDFLQKHLGLKSTAIKKSPETILAERHKTFDHPKVVFFWSFLKADSLRRVVR
jgi:hypothetical protein